VIKTIKFFVIKRPATMPSLLERLLGDGTPDERVVESRQDDADEALRDAAVAGGSANAVSCAGAGRC